jgi:hypothetical protein
MIRRKITKKHLEQAKTRYNFQVLPNSIKSGATNIHGALGEILVIEYYRQKGFEVDDTATMQYDLILNGLKVDVKTRLVNRSPAPWYRISIPAYNTHQKTNFYLFVFIDRKKENVWFAGYIKKDKFFQLAQFNKAGEYFGFNQKYSVDSYTIIARQLERIK